MNRGKDKSACVFEDGIGVASWRVEWEKGRGRLVW